MLPGPTQEYRSESVLHSGEGGVIPQQTNVRCCNGSEVDRFHLAIVEKAGGVEDADSVAREETAQGITNDAESGNLLARVRFGCFDNSYPVFNLRGERAMSARRNPTGGCGTANLLNNSLSAPVHTIICMSFSISFRKQNVQLNAILSFRVGFSHDFRHSCYVARLAPHAVDAGEEVDLDDRWRVG